MSDETPACKFRYLLETHQLGESLFAWIGEYLAANCFQNNRGTIVDAPIIVASATFVKSGLILQAKKNITSKSIVFIESAIGSEAGYGSIIDPGRGNGSIDSHCSLLNRTTGCCLNVSPQTTLSRLLPH